MGDEITSVNRRNFLKNAGIIATASALGACATLRPEMEQAAEAVEAVPTTLTQFRCPVCNKNYGSFADLKNHFGSDHPDAVVPVTTKLNVNGKDCEVLIEPHWTLQRALQFNGFFLGALLFSNRPSEHLERLGFPSRRRTSSLLTTRGTRGPAIPGGTLGRPHRVRASPLPLPAGAARLRPGSGGGRQRAVR